MMSTVAGASTLTVHRSSHGLRVAIVVACSLAAVAAALLNLALGPVDMPLETVWRVLTAWSPSQADALQTHVILDLRAPRVLLAMSVGAALAVSGAAFQALFRNPLADPSLLGISAGAATGAVAFIVLGSQTVPGNAIPRIYALPAAAITGALVAAGLMYLLGKRSGALELGTLLLSGIAINALSSSLSGLLVFASDEQELRELTFWTMGSMARAHWPTLLPALPILAVSVLGLLAMSRAINALALGESVARHLGYRVDHLKALIVLATAVAVGTSVALTGVIGFVGLMVPHAMRAMLGADNRYLFAAGAAAGATLMLVADLGARHWAQPAELPIGIITSLLGGPFFLYLMLAGRSGLHRP